MCQNMAQITWYFDPFTPVYITCQPMVIATGFHYRGFRVVILSLLSCLRPKKYLLLYTYSFIRCWTSAVWMCLKYRLCNRCLSGYRLDVVVSGLIYGNLGYLCTLLVIFKAHVGTISTRMLIPCTMQIRKSYPNFEFDFMI